MSSRHDAAYRAHRLIFKRFSAAQFERAYPAVRGASALPLAPAVKSGLAEGLYNAQKNVLAFAVDADLTLFRRINSAGTVEDNVLCHDLSDAKLRELRAILGYPQAVQQFVPDGAVITDCRRAYAFYCEKILGEGFRVPHLWSESGRFADFKRRNPMAAMLLQKVFDNFFGNLTECLERVSEDIAALQACFLAGKAPRRIANIVASGSDSQRGGKQVLFLDFETSGGVITRVVYKPSDVEIDFLLVGRNSGAVNDFLSLRGDDPGYPRANQSLFELVNATLSDGVVDDPDRSRGLSTYVVLPRNPGSGFSPREMKPPIRQSYGYLEFLAFKPKLPRPPSTTGDTLTDVFTSHPNFWRQSSEVDWIVDKEEDAAACMRNWGRISMLACLMLMRDLHHENRRLRDRNPTLIDLEMTGTGELNSAFETALFFDINRAEHSSRGEQVVELTNGPSGPISRQHGAGIRVWGLDQVYLAPTEGRAGMRCVFNSLQASDDIKQGMYDVLDHVTGEALKSWITRTQLGQVIVRYLSLESFGEIMEGALKELLDIHVLRSTPEDTLQLYWDNRLKEMRRAQIQSWVNNLYAPDKPAFFFQTPDGVGMDVVNLDLPRFYRRMNSKTLLTSSGTPLEFKHQYFDLDDLFPGQDRIAGVSKAAVAEEMKFDRFLQSTGLDDISKVIDARLDLEEDAKKALVEADIRQCGIAPPPIHTEIVSGRA